MDFRERITIEPGRRSGKPCILEREDIRAARAFAAHRERRLIADPAA